MGDLYVMIGISGSGKSYTARQIAEKIPHTIVVSTDAIRKEKWGDESDQREPQLIFKIAYSNTSAYLAEGFNVVFDSTALEPKYRKSLKEIAGKHKIHAVYMDVPVEKCIDNDKERDRTVGEKVIREQLGRLVKPTVDEGWNSIIVVKEDV